LSLDGLFFLNGHGPPDTQRSHNLCPNEKWRIRHDGILETLFFIIMILVEFVRDRSKDGLLLDRILKVAG
jgi:hypothetical protein